MSDLSKDYNFVRLAQPVETTWKDVFDRFKNELLKRGSRLTREDLDWLMDNGYAMPNSPALLTAGSPKGFYASACSSYPLMDTMRDHPFAILNIEGIANDATIVGIGVGFNLSQLRGKNEDVRGRKGVTGGPVSFLRKLSGSLGEITQVTRKSAGMGALSVHHPDVMDFITCKKKDGAIANFNLSILSTDEFMQAVIDDGEFEVRPIKSEPYWAKARPVFDAAIEYGYNFGGEPAWIFHGNIEKDYFLPEFPISSILPNPCSEAILSYGNDPSKGWWLELCALASINLVRYVHLSKVGRRRVVRLCVLMLNDIIDKQDYVSEYHRIGMQEINRKIGIGHAGLATALAAAGYRYSSPEGRKFAANIQSEISQFAMEASAELGDIHGLGRYNASLFSIAPTSTLSNIFNYFNPEGCSYGIEPYFALEVNVHNSYGDFKRTEKIVDFLGGKTDHIECANDLSWRDHVQMVEVVQKAAPHGTFQSTSKTLNFKNNVSIEEYKEAVIYCWQHGIKGISVYRDGSRANQVLTDAKSAVKADDRPKCIEYRSAPHRPESLECDIHHLTYQGQKWIVLVGKMCGKPFEVFAGLEESIALPKKHKSGRIVAAGKKGNKKYNLHVGEGEDEIVVRDIPKTFDNPGFGTWTRTISLSLRHGIPVQYLCEQLAKTEEFSSFLRMIARILKKYIAEGASAGEACECGGQLTYVSGCQTCLTCGKSKCG